MFFSAIAARLARQAGLRPGDRVLDAGCVAGAALIHASRAAGPEGRRDHTTPAETLDLHGLD